MQICAYCGNDRNRDTATFCARCGNALPGMAAGRGATGQLSPQTIIHGRYVIVQRVGQGGMGAVYQVTDLHIQGKVWALKEMSDAALNDPADRAQAVAAFQQEAQLLATLSHPNLPQVIDYFTEAGRHYLVMDFVAGETLDETLSRSGLRPEGQVLAWAEQLCEVLDYLHNQPQPVIFRDLKPGNIMVTPSGRIKLIDFGIARFFKPGQQGDTQPIGTAGYAPPEQHGQGQTDARSDVYSLGVTLHELLTGHDPTQTPFQLPPARQLEPALSDRVEQVILRATAMDPVHRFASAAEVKQALTAPRPGPKSAPPLPGPPPPPPLPSSPAPTTKRRPTGMIVAITTILCLTSVMGVWIILKVGPPTPTPQPTTHTTITATTVPLPISSAPPISDSPSPTSTSTDVPSPTPSRTATATPSATPTQSDDEAAIRAVIWRYVDLKARAMGRWETDELDTTLRGGSLKTQLSSVKWLREHNSRWEYDLHSMTFERFEYLSGSHVRALVTKIETGRYYHQGSPTPSQKKSYYNYQYEIWYELEKIAGQWYITNIDL